MQVYPLTIHLGPLEITGYGVMMMVAFLVGGWVIQEQLRHRKLNQGYAADIVVAAVIGGIVGGKLWYVVLHPEAPLFSRGGLVWYGGLAGGSAAVYLNGLRLRVPTRLTAELVAPALAVGYALGRVGCFLVQDDYGKPASLPWALRFPEGQPPSTAFNLERLFGVPMPNGAQPTDVLAVHPTQLYETAAMLIAFWLLWRLLNHRHAMGWLFATYLTLAGVERFLVELLRAKDDRLLGPFTVAQAASATLVAIGLVLMLHWWKKDELSPGSVPAALRVADGG